jgi:2'-5' RNA ligase
MTFVLPAITKEMFLPRLFVAIATPDSVRPKLIAVRDRLKAVRTDVRWERDDKLHCTLKFLGDTRDELVPRIIAALHESCRTASPLSLSYAGLGCFPGRRDPRVIWAAIQDPDGALKGVAASIDVAMGALGFELERRPFSPHVTFGRVKGQRGMAQLLATMETITFVCPPVLIQEVLLVRSELRPSGSEYSVVERIPMSGKKLVS